MPSEQPHVHEWKLAGRLHGLDLYRCNVCGRQDRVDEGAAPPPVYDPPTLQLIHQDSRGEMYQILLPTGQEIMLLHSIKGAVRGGHSHTANEVVALVSGKIMYHKAYEGAPIPDRAFELEAGQVTVNLADLNHYGEFLEDSWLLEYKYGPKSAVGEWENVEFEPFRKVVRESMQA